MIKFLTDSLGVVVLALEPAEVFNTEDRVLSPFHSWRISAGFFPADVIAAIIEAAGFNKQSP